MVDCASVYARDVGGGTFLKFEGGVRGCARLLFLNLKGE